MSNSAKRAPKKPSYINELIFKRQQRLSSNANLIAEMDQLRAEIDRLQAENTKWQIGWPPGHFYSPIPSLEAVKAKEDTIFHMPEHIPGIELNARGQLKLLEELKQFYHDQPFAEHKQDGLRYYFNNPNYSYGDAIVLHTMLRHLRPRRIIEIGSGFSSCVTLDTNEHFLDNSMECTFIEPHPELLFSLLNEDELGRVHVIPTDLQDVDLSLFADLSAGDILFIDSTHVSKINSDVNYILFEILPCLQKGVYVHIHDIFYPFEYPREWIYQGRAWNEAYILRAFLEYNDVYEIQYFNSFMGMIHRDELAQTMPLCASSPGAGIWLKKMFAGI